MENVSDDLFESYAQDQQREAEERSSRGSGGNSNFTFEVIKWTGLKTNEIKLVRAFGGPPDSDVDEFTARTTRVSWIIGDDKKKFRCILPEAADAPDHLLWNIIARVKKSEWIDGVRTSPVERDFPEIYNIVHKNGVDPKDKSYIFEKGWTGRHVLLMNVLDREMMDWHTENKHTVLISRNIGVGKDGTEFPEVGVPSYGFAGALGNLFKFYKSWEKYDIGITRTGLKEAPYRVINASKYLEETGSKADLVSQESLTDDERAYEQYDLKKLFKITSYTKIYNHLKGKIARIDAALDTNFLDELKFLVEKEKEALDEQKAAETQAEIVGETPVVENKVTPTRTRTVVKGNDFSKLAGWDKLTDDERSGIENVDFTTSPISITYVDKEATLLACPDCGTPGPETYNACAACGLEF